MAARVEFEISAVDKATSILNILRDNLVKTGGAAGIMGAAFITAGVAVAGALAKATSEAQTYDQQIKGLMASTGSSADQTSRLVQVLDDAGIEFSTVTKAMKEMSKDGTEPSIEQLATLSEQFLSLHSGAERGKFLLDNFGKSGMDMARAMELGGDAIRKMNEEQKGGLILTQKNILASEEYRIKVDALSDSWEGFKIKVGNEVIPVLNSLIDEIDGASAAEVKHAKYLDLAKESLSKSTGEANIATPAAARLAAQLQNNAQVAENMANNYTLMAKALGTVSIETENLQQNNEAYLGLIGTMQSAEDSYNQNAASLAAERIQIETDRATAISQGWWEGSEKIKEYDAALAENSAAVVANAAEHDKASKQIMFGLMQQQMAVDGLDAAETATLTRLGVSWGLLSQSIVDQAGAAMRSADAMNKAIQNIQDKTVRITVIQEGAAASNISYELGTQLGYRTGGKRNAGGGSYVIPKSFGNEGFNMGGLGTASGGERVTISQNGQQQNAAPAMDMKLLARTIVTAIQQAG